jgi:hypothetical protein
VINLNIVSHCWSQKHPEFAAALVYQLSSLAIWPRDEIKVKATIVHCPEDLRVVKILDFFQDHIDLCKVALSLPELSRRSIGRNIAAKSVCTDSDMVWFADVDYVFRSGCLEALANVQCHDELAMVFPESVQISTDHKTGGADLNKVLLDIQEDNLHLVDVMPEKYVLKEYKKAIGGAQIVRGDIVRRLGYCDDYPCWQVPLLEPFSDTKEDVCFRRAVGKLGNIKPITLPNLYRLRHIGGHPK